MFYAYFTHLILFFYHVASLILCLVFISFINQPVTHFHYSHLHLLTLALYHHLIHLHTIAHLVLTPAPSHRVSTWPVWWVAGLPPQPSRWGTSCYKWMEWTCARLTCPQPRPSWTRLSALSVSWCLAYSENQRLTNSILNETQTEIQVELHRQKTRSETYSLTNSTFTLF